MDAENPSLNGDIIFYGIDGGEAEQFIRSITKMAHEAGRYRDNDWIIERAEVALAGDALRWYIELDQDIQTDWKRLQKAIMQRYPPPAQRIFSTNIQKPLTIPTPAAAPPMPAGAPKASRKELFCLRLLYGNAITSYYLGLYQGDLVVTSKRGEAVVVFHDSRMNELRVAKQINEPGSRIAVKWFNSMLGGPDSIADEGRLELVDEQGRSLSQRPVPAKLSSYSWKLQAQNLLKSIAPEDTNRYAVLYTDSEKEHAERKPIQAALGASMLLFGYHKCIDLKLEPL